jgi:glutamine---fructose-6-phosphate transaminase (isomerizing)
MPNSSAVSHLIEAVRAATGRLRGAYALGVIDAADPEHLVAAREGSPLVIGVGFGEHFIASDVFALLPVTNRFIFLEEGDLAELTRDQVRIWDRAGQRVERPIKTSTVAAEATERGPVSPLHAEGNLRAAARHRRHPGRAVDGRAGVA